jgi:membrane protease YdiL (CAAX protease family)
MKNYDKQTIAQIRKPIVQAAIIMLLFYAIEIPMVYFNVFPDKNTLYIADIIIRVIGGTAGLILLNGYSKRGESKCTLKQLFTNKISRKTWLIMLPLIIDILLPFLNIFTATIFTTRFIVTLSILIVQQFATGFYEESVQRGLMMNGLIKFNISTVKRRLFTVLVTGLFFGLGHAPNIAFGDNPLIQVPSAMCIGMFWAAVYMLSDNLLLVMLLHAFTDSTFRIVHGLFGYAREGFLYQAIECSRDIIEYVILPALVICICIWFDKFKNNAPEDGST